MKYTWFRVYNEIRTDSKIRRLTPAERWVFVGLMCLANEGRERGTIELAPGLAYETQEIADGIGVSIEIVEATLDKAEKLDMLERRPGGVIVITNMKKRQYQSDISTGRVRKHREKKRAERSRETLSSSVSETFQQTVSETHQSRAEHIRAEAESETDVTASTSAAFCAWLDARNNYMTQLDTDNLADLIKEYSDEWVAASIQEANKSKRGKGISFKYIIAILERWKKEGFQSAMRSESEGMDVTWLNA